MAKSELIEKTRAQIIIDNKSEKVLIRNLNVNDHEIYEILHDQKDFERIEYVKRALKVGAIALRNVVVAEKVDFVQREFEKLCFEVEKLLTTNLGKEGMKGELDKVFGDKGELHDCLEKVFGDGGSLSRDLLDMNNIKSPIGQLRETIESYFVGKDSEIYGLLDPNAEDSPIARLRKEIMEKMNSIETLVTSNIVKKNVISKAPQKGFDFEDDLEPFLYKISKPFGDLVERCGKEKGKLGNLKGDFVVTLCDPSVKGQAPKIVIEAKTRGSVSLSTKGLLGELRGAIQNRDAVFAIAVTDTVVSEEIGAYREFEGDKVLCSFEDNGLPLEVAYRAARTYILMRLREAPTDNIDVSEVCGLIAKIGTDLNSVRGIKAKLTSIDTTTEAIANDIGNMENNIRANLKHLQQLINKT